MKQAIQSRSLRSILLAMAALSLLMAGAVGCEGDSDSSEDRPANWLNHASEEERKIRTVELDGMKLTLDLPTSYKRERGGLIRLEYHAGKSSDEDVPRLKIDTDRHISVTSLGMEKFSRTEGEVLQNEMKDGAWVLTDVGNYLHGEETVTRVFRMIGGTIVECEGRLGADKAEPEVAARFIEDICRTIRPEGTEKPDANPPTNRAAWLAASDMKTIQLEDGLTVQIPAGYEEWELMARGKMGAWKSPAHKALSVTVESSISSSLSGEAELIERRDAKVISREETDNSLLAVLQDDDRIAVVNFLEANGKIYECETTMNRASERDIEDIVEFGKKTCGTLSVAKPTN